MSDPDQTRGCYPGAHSPGDEHIHELSNNVKATAGSSRIHTYDDAVALL